MFQTTSAMEPIQDLQPIPPPLSSQPTLASSNTRSQAPQQDLGDRYPNALQDVPSSPNPSPNTPSPPVDNRSMLERLYEMGKPVGAASEVNRLNNIIGQVGQELHFLSEKSRDCLYDKVRSLAQIKRLRDGLKNVYKLVYNLQGAMASYQAQLKEMKRYLQENKDRVVVIDNQKLENMYNMVRSLQNVAENMVSGTLRRQEG